MSYPALHVKVGQIVENALHMQQLCQDHGIAINVVTKVISGYRPLVEALYNAGIVHFGESRLQNVDIFDGLGGKFWMMRLPMISEVDHVVEKCWASLVSEPAVLEALNDSAKRHHTIHKVHLMAEIGDLREGCLHDELLDIAKGFRDHYPYLEFRGIGANLSCYGGIIPSEENMGMLVQLAEAIEQEANLPVKFISGGNSSCLKMLLEGTLPKRINHLRLGESIFLGNIPCFEEPLETFHRNNFVLEAEIIELKEKPSVPWGTSLVDSFGHKVHFEDKGIRKRAILAIGKQDIDLDGITPLDEGVEVLGGSSDHLLLDVTDSPRALQIGDTMTFSLNYATTLRIMTSPYIDKIPE